MRSRQVKYGSADVPFLSDQEIAGQAHRLRHDYATMCSLPLAKPVKPEYFVWDLLLDRERLDLDLEASLPQVPGQRILGMMIAEEDGGIIRIDKAIADTPLLAFTVAHEIGHWVLHRDLVRTMGQRALVETAETVGECEPTTSRVEWQANRFAVHLLLPEDVFRVEFARRYGRRTMSAAKARYASKIEYATFLATAGQSSALLSMVQVFGTSHRSTAIRLVELGLIVD